MLTEIAARLGRRVLHQDSEELLQRAAGEGRETDPGGGHPAAQEQQRQGEYGGERDGAKVQRAHVGAFYRRQGKVGA